MGNETFYWDGLMILLLFVIFFIHFLNLLKQRRGFIECLSPSLLIKACQCDFDPVDGSLCYDNPTSISCEIRLESTSPAFCGFKNLSNQSLQRFNLRNQNLTSHLESNKHSNNNCCGQNHYTQKSRRGNNIHHDEQRKYDKRGFSFDK